MISLEKPNLYARFRKEGLLQSLCPGVWLGCGIFSCALSHGSSVFSFYCKCQRFALRNHLQCIVENVTPYSLIHSLTVSVGTAKTRIIFWQWSRKRSDSRTAKLGRNLSTTLRIILQTNKQTSERTDERGRSRYFLHLQYRYWYYNERENILLHSLLNFNVPDSFRRSLYDAISSTALSQLPADRPPGCYLLASRLADQIWTSPLSVRPATFACGL